jgi:hypothetical protein
VKNYALGQGNKRPDRKPLITTHSARVMIQLLNGKNHWDMRPDHIKVNILQNDPVQEPDKMYRGCERVINITIKRKGSVK